MSTNPPSTKSNGEQFAEVNILRANLDKAEHQSWFLDLLDAYMRHPMGDSRPIPAENRERLVHDLHKNEASQIFFAIAPDQAVGMAVCFVGYSTFYARPLVNIHDLFVQEPYRGSGVGLQLLQAVESLAVELGCCKMTLEVRDDNTRAQDVYRRYGFDSGTPPFEFWTKRLTSTS